MAEDAIRLQKRGSDELKAKVLSGEVSFKQAIKEVPTRRKQRSAKTVSRQAVKESELEFLERVKQLAFAPLKEADAISRRPWNIENSSKAALGLGLKRILQEVELRLTSLHAGQSPSSSRPSKHG
jgi:hypothetical protein